MGFLGEKGLEHFLQGSILPLFGTWYITIFVSKDCCNAGTGVQPIGTGTFFITQSLHVANNSPLLCAEVLWTLWRSHIILCKGYIITCMTKVDRSTLCKKPSVSELLFLTVQPRKH